MIVRVGSLPQLGPELLQAWDERTHDNKFILVCGVHNGADAFWSHEHLTEWSKRGALRLLTISDQYGRFSIPDLIALTKTNTYSVSNFFKTRLSEWADSKNPAERLSWYEYVKINSFYPVANFTDFPLPDKSEGPEVPCTALLQGGFEKKRRDYDRIFLDLVRLLRGKLLSVRTYIFTHLSALRPSPLFHRGSWRLGVLVVRCRAAVLA